MEVIDSKILLEIEKRYREKEQRVNSLPFNPRPQSAIAADELMEGKTKSDLKIIRFKSLKEFREWQRKF